MKKAMQLLMVCLALAMQGCYWGIDDTDRFDIQYSEYRPLTMPRADLEQSVVVRPPQTLHNPGKIYSYGHYILVNERYEGVHIVNNQNPEQPQNIAFLKIPGCIDIAAKDNVLYADNAIDLVAIDLTDPQNPVVTKRVPEVFPVLTPPDEIRVNPDYLPAAGEIIYNWVKI